MGTKDDFIGTWSLAEYLLIRADGVARKPWGDEVRGLLIYSPEGRMSANLMPAGPFPHSPAALTGAPEKSRRAGRYIGYAGTFTVESNTITHHVEVSLFTKWIGLPQVRYFELSAERLILRTPPIPRQGHPLVGQLTWNRIR